MIDYRQGNVSIIHREGLAACGLECYGVVRHAHHRLSCTVSIARRSFGMNKNSAHRVAVQPPMLKAA